MSRSVALARVTDAPPRARKAPRRRQELARVALLNPRTIGRLTAAWELGHALRCRLEGTTLVVEVEREVDRG